ncbi:MAG TPA: hypothetical protein DDW76_32850 [Cyanobacteria bacterium UBA11369]|nr:hypothetical protein [Cyanobacteria bacterium UBA11371]HBE35927.1 hypothetical protein [Cyanobacteria bacterium UBA11368]HBE53417.1 hypothetical protein [Cyanobacteria bacterium UBA11369]
MPACIGRVRLAGVQVGGKKTAFCTIYSIQPMPADMISDLARWLKTGLLSARFSDRVRKPGFCKLVENGARCELREREK